MRETERKAEEKHVQEKPVNAVDVIGRFIALSQQFCLFLLLTST